MKAREREGFIRKQERVLLAQNTRDASIKSAPEEDDLIGTSKETLTAREAAEANDGNHDGGYASTFSFDGLILETDKTYTFKFVATSGDPAYYLWSKSTGGAEGIGYTSGATGYLPWIRLSVAAVPEPSAFGMLAGLGALALVASRRRR